MNIVVLCGGISTEREISIKTGANVCAALRKKGHNAVLVDSYFGIDNPNFFESDEEYDLAMERIKIDSMTSEIKSNNLQGRPFFGPNVLFLCQQADIVFIALHGKYGEDGMVQAVLDMNCIKYTGSGPLASGIGMDKGVTKQIFLSQNVPTPRSVWFKKGEDTDFEKLEMDFPVVVKACNGGSSVGVYFANDKLEYDECIEKCFTFDTEVLVEEFIKGREFSIGVLDGEVLPPVEIIPKDGWYDYTNKYEPGATEEVCPANLTEEQTRKMQKVAKDACSVIGCQVYARADVLMSENNHMYCLEVNTLPGMTSTSLIPQEAAAIGMSFEDLCEKVIMTSLKKYE